MKFLIIQTAFLGDVVLTLPLISGLKGRFPGCSISMVVTPAGADMAGLFSMVDEVITFDKRVRDKGMRGLLRVATVLKKGNFDALFCPHRSLRSGVLARLSGISPRYGFASGPAAQFMTRKLDRPGTEHSESAILELAGLPDFAAEARTPTSGAASGGGDAGLLSGLLKIPPEALKIAEGRIGGGMRGGPLVTLVVGSNWETKRWLSGRYTLLARELVSRGMHVAVEGGREDIPTGKEVLSVAGEGVSDLTGNSITEAAAVISISDLVIGGDTGLMHLARVTGRRLLMIFGPTDHRLHRFGPGQKAMVAPVPCRPCSRHGPDSCPEQHFGCMNSVTTDAVLHEALALLE